MTLASLWKRGIQSSCTGPKCTPRTTIVPPGRDELAAFRQALLRPGRLDHDVVQPVRVDTCPKALPGFLLVRMASLQRDLCRAKATSTGDGQEPESARADDRDPCARSGPGEAERVPRDSGRFHDRRITYVEAGRERRPAGLRVRGNAPPCRRRH